MTTFDIMPILPAAFRQTGPWNKLVFNRQVRANRYLFRVAQLLNSQSGERSVLELKATARTR